MKIYIPGHGFEDLMEGESETIEKMAERFATEVNQSVYTVNSYYDGLRREWCKEAAIIDDMDNGLEIDDPAEEMDRKTYVMYRCKDDERQFCHKALTHEDAVAWAMDKFHAGMIEQFAIVE